MSRTFHNRKPKKPLPINGRIQKSKTVHCQYKFMYEKNLMLKIGNIFENGLRDRFLIEGYWDTSYTTGCKCKEICIHTVCFARVTGPSGAGFNLIKKELTKLLGKSVNDSS